MSARAKKGFWGPPVKGKLDVGYEIPWCIIAGVLVAVIVVGAVLWFRSWETSGTVRFDYRMSFAYLRSEENIQLENIVLKWSAPKVENSLPEFVQGKSIWTLYYIENDNTLTLETTESGIINLREGRTSQLGIYTLGYENIEYGPVLVAWLDKLYPREIFCIDGFVVAKSNLTLRVYSQAAPISGWQAFGQENQKIDLSFQVGLWRDNVSIEQFELTEENETGGWYWLGSA